MEKDKTTNPERARSPLRLFFGFALLAVGIFAVVNGVISITDNKQQLIAPEGVITVEIADTPELRTLGLSGRSELADTRGVLFVFDNPSDGNCFWMKDMQFPIDMIWMDENKQVITVHENVAPDTYPESFCPTSPSKYGLEVNSGRAGELGISENETLRF